MSIINPQVTVIKGKNSKHRKDPQSEFIKKYNDDSSGVQSYKNDLTPPENPPIKKAPFPVRQQPINPPERAQERRSEDSKDEPETSSGVIDDMTISSLVNTSRSERENVMRETVKKMIIKSTYNKTKDVLKQATSKVQSNNGEGTLKEGVMQQMVGDIVNESVRDLIKQLEHKINSKNTEVRELINKTSNTTKLGKDDVDRIQGWLKPLSDEMDVLLNLLSCTINSYVVDRSSS